MCEPTLHDAEDSALINAVSVSIVSFIKTCFSNFTCWAQL